MSQKLVFRFGDESLAEVCIERANEPGPPLLRYSIACYDYGRGAGPSPFPLGPFLRALSLGIEECAEALATESVGDVRPDQTRMV